MSHCSLLLMNYSTKLVEDRFNHNVQSFSILILRIQLLSKVNYTNCSNINTNCLFIVFCFFIHKIYENY